MDRGHVALEGPSRRSGTTPGFYAFWPREAEPEDHPNSRPTDQGGHQAVSPPTSDQIKVIADAMGLSLTEAT